MNKEEITFDTNDDIIMQIEMLSFMAYNDQIAFANENIGDIYSFKDIEYMKSLQEHYEKQLSYKAIEQLQRENKQLKEIIKDNTTLIKDNCGNYEELTIEPLKLIQYKEKNKQLKERIDKAIEYLNKIPNLKTKIGNNEILLGQTLYQKDIIKLVKILERYKGE